MSSTVANKFIFFLFVWFDYFDWFDFRARARARLFWKIIYIFHLIFFCLKQLLLFCSNQQKNYFKFRDFFSVWINFYFDLIWIFVCLFVDKKLKIKKSVSQSLTARRERKWFKKYKQFSQIVDIFFLFLECFLQQKNEWMKMQFSLIALIDVFVSAKFVFFVWW